MKRFPFLAASRARCAAVACLLGLAAVGLACDEAAPSGPGGDPKADRTPKPDRLAALAATRPAGAGPYTWHDYYRECLEFNRATLADAYHTGGARGPWDAAAERFLERVALHATVSSVSPCYQPPEFPQRPELIAESKAILDLRCGDPLIAYWHAALRYDNGDVAGATPLLKTAALARLETPYPPYRKVAAARRAGLLEFSFDNSDAPARANAGFQQGLMLAKLRTGIERRKVLQTLSEILEPREGRAYENGVQNMAREAGADRWVVDTLLGKAHVKLAWDARGSGWASSVTDEGWKDFHKHLALARDHLTAAWKLHPELPEAPTAMITVAMGAGDELREDPMKWFERAVAAQMDYTPAYEAMVGGPLLPRWGGSHEAMWQLGLRAAKSERFDTILPYELVDTLLTIVTDTEGSWAFLSRPGVYEALGKVFDGYERQPGRPYFDPPWHRSMRAAIAWRAERYDDARRALDQLGDGVQLKAFTACKAKSAEAAVGHVYAMTGPEAERVARAEAALKAGERAAALTEFQAAAKALAGEARTRPYFEARLASLDRRDRLADGQWVSLPASEGLPGWQAMQGQWEFVEGDKSMRAAGPQSGAVIMCAENLSSRFELAGRIVPEAGAGGAIVFESPERELTWVTFSPNLVRVQFEGGHVPFQVELPAGDVDFTCKVTDGLMALQVGDGRVVRFRMPFLTGFRIGFGVMPGGAARFAELRARRMPAGEPANGGAGAGAKRADAP
jgi:hypothetical protein